MSSGDMRRAAIVRRTSRLNIAVALRTA